MNAFPHTLRGSEADATVAAFLNPQPVRLSAADAWEAGRAARIATMESWSAFAKTGAARGFRLTAADREALRPVEVR